MAPQSPSPSPVGLQAALPHATSGFLESQDSQALTIAMHREHGISPRSSPPPSLHPLDSGADGHQRSRQHPRPPKVHPKRVDAKPPSTATTAAGAEAPAGVSQPEPREEPGGPVRKRKNQTKHNSDSGSPAGDATGDKGAGPEQGPDGGRVTAAASLRDPTPPQPSSHPHNASYHRVFFSSPALPSSRHAARPPTSPDVVSASAPPGGRPKPHPNETVATRLSPAAVLPILHTYSKKKKKKSEARTTRMASSPFSSTQSNQARSYDNYLQRGDDLIPPDPVRRPTRSSPPSHPSSPTSHRDEGATTCDADTGATSPDEDTGPINIDFSAVAGGDTQTSIPDSLATRATTQQQDASPGYVFGYPETPAAPRNPFHGNTAASLMRGSQMFKQTQYSSALKGAFSPTSSRPSPDNFQLNSISPNPSPWKRCSGPSPLQGAFDSPYNPLVVDTSPQHADEDDTPHRDDLAARKIPKSLAPIPPPPPDTYRPVPRWEDRGPSSPSGSDAYESDEDSSDEQERRHQRAAFLRAQAQRHLGAISLKPLSDEASIVPYTKKQSNPAAQAASTRATTSVTENTQSRKEDQEAPLADSQDGVVPPPASLGQSAGEGGISSNDVVVPNTDPGPASAPTVTDDEAAVQIPETSPARLRLVHAMNSSSPLPEPVSLPPQQPTEGTDVIVCITEEDSGAGADDDLGRPSIVVSSSPPARAASTGARASGHKTRPRAPPTCSSTSPLTTLTVTPALSTKTTPLTEASPAQITPISTSTGGRGTSPAVAKARRQNTKLVSKTAPATGRASTRRTTRPSLPSDVSVSTDDLARSPPRWTPNRAFEQSTRLPKLGRTSMRESPVSRPSSRGGTKIFAGMVFAISFQGKQPDEDNAQYNARMAVLTQTTNKVKQGGGKVLPDGFDQLFEFSPVKNADREAVTVSSTPQPDDDIDLALNARQTGFTALIADGHSRKVKYMQALALGLPCIHERWVTTCVEKQRLVGWSDYLLCAGHSSFLGDAIKSRNLPPYDAATATLREVVESRPRLLAGSRILLLMPRAESKKAAYIFLARVLGASLSRVYTVEEARRQLKAREEAGKPFDWLYAVDEKVSADDMFTAPAQANRKRKRQSAVFVDPPAKRVRALSDELVIQSLILGRVLDEEERVAAAVG